MMAGKTMGRMNKTDADGKCLRKNRPGRNSGEKFRSHNSENNKTRQNHDKVFN